MCSKQNTTKPPNSTVLYYFIIFLITSAETGVEHRYIRVKNVMKNQLISLPYWGSLELVIRWSVRMRSIMLLCTTETGAGCWPPIECNKCLNLTLLLVNYGHVPDLLCFQQRFTGNNDANTVNKQYFILPLRARYIRLYNYSIEKLIDPCMRLEVYGCDVPPATVPPATVPPATVPPATVPLATVPPVTKPNLMNKASPVTKKVSPVPVAKTVARTTKATSVRTTQCKPNAGVIIISLNIKTAGFFFTTLIETIWRVHVVACSLLPSYWLSGLCL